VSHRVRRVGEALNIDDLRALARRRLPRGLYDFVNRGAEDEATMRANAQSIARTFLRQRVGVDISRRDISTTIFGTQLGMPVGIAVTGLAGMLNHDGERKLARAAAAAGVPFTIGSSNFTAQADLKPICGDLLWRQIYPPRDRALLDHHLAVSRESGVKVLQVTLDSPVVGKREYMQRSGWGPGIMHLGTYLDMLGAPYWLFGTLARYMLAGGLPEVADMPPGERKFWGGSHSYAVAAQDFTWDDLKALRRRWDGVLVAKGISTAADARLAAACGVDGVVVSNHGGRSLDGCVPSFGALREVADAVAPQLAVIVDGGFRRGADVVKAIALGASLVMVGRATLNGLAAGGEAGAARALAIFREEIDRSLGLVGCRNLGELTREHLALPGEAPQILTME
jgi:isopentenyl diphosphate isomerase/L-lactate dehydrogenase-like FMN-dependent dehydrogenase